jgi:hypothetical protein
MRKAVELVGLVLLVEGVSGTVDHLAVQPFFSFALDFVNRVVIPRLDFLAGHELLANLAVAALGAVLILAANAKRSPEPS